MVIKFRTHLNKARSSKVNNVIFSMYWGTILVEWQWGHYTIRWDLKKRFISLIHVRCCSYANASANQYFQKARILWPLWTEVRTRKSHMKNISFKGNKLKLITPEIEGKNWPHSHAKILLTFLIYSFSFLPCDQVVRGITWSKLKANEAALTLEPSLIIWCKAFPTTRAASELFPPGVYHNVNHNAFM